MYNAVLHFMRNVKAPEGFKKLAGLMATSAFLEGRCFLPDGPLNRLYPNLFVIVIAPPGMGKSLISNVTSHLTVAFNRRYEEDQAKQILLSPKKLNPAAFVQFLVKYGRKEADIAGTLEPTSPVFISSSELSVLISNSQHGNMLEDMLDLYDCPPSFAKYTRMNGMENPPRPVPTMIGCTTPSFWKSFMPTNLANDGFTSRALLFYSNAFVERDAVIRWGSMEDVTACVEEGYRLKNLSGKFAFASSAWEWYEEVFHPANNALMRKHFQGSDLWQGYTNRRSDQLKKIAMCFSAARGNDLIIRIEDLTQAQAMLHMIEDNLDALLITRSVMRSADTREPILAIMGDGLARTYKEISRALVARGIMQLRDDTMKVLNTLTDTGELVVSGDLYRKP